MREELGEDEVYCPDCGDVMLAGDGLYIISRGECVCEYCYDSFPNEDKED